MDFLDTIKDQLKTYCPKCKTEIYRHAHVCMRCGYDLKSPAHRKLVEKENKLIRYWLYFCIFIFVVSIFSSSNVGVALILCFLLFGAGVLIIHKISKYINFFH